MNIMRFKKAHLKDKKNAKKTSPNNNLVKIIGKDGLILGYEFSINSNNIKKPVKGNIYHLELLFPQSTRKLLTQIEGLGKNLRLFEGLFIFFNLERTNLCDKFLMCEIILLKEKLSVYGVSLVVVITEHIHCKPCYDVTYGLDLLKMNNVLLAADEKGIRNQYQSQLSLELDNNYYSFIKVEHRNDFDYYQTLKQLSKKHSINIVVDNVNTDTDLTFINDSNVNVWGYQGGVRLS